MMYGCVCVHSLKQIVDEMKVLGFDPHTNEPLEDVTPPVPVCEALRVLWISIPIACAKAGRKVL